MGYVRSKAVCDMCDWEMCVECVRGMREEYEVWRLWDVYVS